MRTAVRGLAGTISSLGLSFSELARFRIRGTHVVTRARALAERCGVERVVVHADSWALALTTGEPERELEALLAGSLLAATRAACGRIAVPDGCPPGAVFAEPPAPPTVYGEDGWNLACCAVPHLARPAATIGLGDTFLAGSLLVLGQPERRAAPGLTEHAASLL
jgi:ADP-dependent phosphofructokinase/glucokinase